MSCLEGDGAQTVLSSFPSPSVGVCGSTVPAVGCSRWRWRRMSSETIRAPSISFAYLLTRPGAFSLSLSVFGQRLLPWTPHDRTLSGLPPVEPMTLVSSANFRKGLSATDAYRASADLVGFSLTPYLSAMRLNPAQFSWTTYLYNVLQFNLVKPGSRAKATMERSSEYKITAVRIIRTRKKLTFYLWSLRCNNCKQKNSRLSFLSCGGKM